MTTKKEAWFREVVENKIPFNRFLGIRLGEIGKGRAVLHLPFREEFIGDDSRPALHGGVISTLVDMAGGVAIWTELVEGDRLSTVDLLVDYLMPAGKETLEAEAHVVRMGNSVAVVRITVTQRNRQNIVAQGRAVYNVKRKRRRISTERRHKA